MAIRVESFEDIRQPDGGVNVAKWYLNQDLAFRRITLALECIQKELEQRRGFGVR